MSQGAHAPIAFQQVMTPGGGGGGGGNIPDTSQADPILILAPSGLSGSNGDAISTWTDSSGLGYNATQPSGARQATKQSVTFATKTFNVARFDSSVPNGMITPISVGTFDFSLFMLWRPASLAGIYAAITSNSQNWIICTYSSEFLAYLNGYSALDTTINNTDFFLIEVRATDGGSCNVYINGTATNDGGDGSWIGPQGISIGGIGAGIGSAYSAYCDITDIRIYNTRLSDLDATAVRADYQTKYNYLKL